MVAEDAAVYTGQDSGRMKDNGLVSCSKARATNRSKVLVAVVFAPLGARCL